MTRFEYGCMYAPVDRSMLDIDELDTLLRQDATERAWEDYDHAELLIGPPQLIENFSGVIFVYPASRRIQT